MVLFVAFFPLLKVFMHPTQKRMNGTGKVHFQLSGMWPRYDSFKQWKKQLNCFFLPQWKVPEGNTVPTDMNNFSFNMEVSGKSDSYKEFLVFQQLVFSY